MIFDFTIPGQSVTIIGAGRIVVGLDVDDVDRYIAETAFAEPADELTPAEAEARAAREIHAGARPVVYKQKGEKWQQN